jgi:hypothetical protein
MRKVEKSIQENVSVPEVTEVKEQKPRKVCILGYAPHLKEAPFNDESWEMWGINSLYRQLEGVPMSRFSAWFEIHSVEFLANRPDKKAVQAHFKALSEMKIPLYMKDHYDIFPTSVKYPLEEVVNYLKCSRYFTNTISYMIALAIAQQYTDIAIYGVDMAVGSEYEHQRPSCEYFMGIAEGRGINTYLPDTCDLLRTNFLYGLEDIKEDAWRKKLGSMKSVIRQREQEAEKAVMHNEAVRNQYKGAQMAMDEVDKIWSNNGY